MSITRLQKSLRTLLLLSFILFQYQSSQAGIFTWIKNWGAEKSNVAFSIAGSTMSLTSGSPIGQGTTGTVGFQVSTVSPDSEYIPGVAITLPSGWTVACNSDDGGLHGDAVSCTPSSNVINYSFSGGSFPGLQNGDSWNCIVNVTVPSGATPGNHTVNYTLTGDNYGAAPHSVSGTMTVVVISSDGPGNASCVNNDEVGGIVFEDINADGIFDNNEPYFENISVSLFDDNGQVGSSVNTNINGEYLFTSLTSGGSYRVEFSVPSNKEESPIGTDSKSIVQFVTAGSCDNSLGLISPEDYCNTDPYLIIPCYVDGVYNGSNSSEAAVAKVLESADGHDFTGATKTGDYEASAIATHLQVGSTYGVAWQKTSNKYYLAAFHKRYVGFGPDGPDAIYQLDLNGNVTGSIELDDLLSNSNTAGTDVHDFTPSGGIVYDLGTGDVSFDAVGKRSFGDIEISSDNNTLFIVNLFDKKIYALDVTEGNTNNVTINTSWSAPDATSAGRHRPFGLAYHNEKLWIGSVDENGSNAYVHSLDPSGSTFNLELTIPLNYTRQAWIGDANGALSANWNAWATNTGITYGDNGSGEIGYPQPILSDIEFATDGAMIIGFRDRFGDQTGAGKRFRASDAIDTWGTSAGDLLKACYSGGTFTLETGSGGSCSGVGGITNSGPGGVEFYHWDLYDWETTWNPGSASGGFHWETTQGGLMQLNSRSYVVSTAMDPFNDYSGGFLKFDNATGGREGVGTGSSTVASLTGGYTLFETGDYSSTPPTGNTLAKANGLGDIEAACSALPLEIGNYVWEDADGDGIQDPSENGIAGVTVTFTDDSDVVLGTTTTDSDGKYIFNNANVTGDIEYNTDYKVKITLANVQSIAPAVQSTSGTNLGNGINDNDASLVGLAAVATLTTGGSGATNYAVDFGFSKAGSVGNRIWVDEDGDGDQDAGEPGIPNVVVELLDGVCTAGLNCPTRITDANGGYIFKNVAPGTYTVQVVSGLPTGANIIYDEDDNTTSPDGVASVTVTPDEYITADFGYNYVSKIDSDSPSGTAVTGAIGNRIWNDANSNGVQDPGEAGIPNITVNLLTDTDLDGRYTSSGTTTTTDEYGNYMFDELAPGAYVVEVVSSEISSAGFTTTPTGDPDNDGNNISEPVIIAPGDVWLGGDFGYNNASNPADIGSTIFVDANGDGSYNIANDLPLGGVTVALVNDADGGDDWDSNESVVATTISAADGSYLFPDLPAGDYVVVVTDVNNVIGNLSNTVDPQGGNDGISGVTLAASDNLTQNFGYVPNGHTSTKSLIGDIIFLDADGGNDYDLGEPGIEGVEVQLLDGGTDAVISSTETNENGQYFFGNLDANDYKIKVVTSSLPAGMINSIDPDGASPGNDETNSFSLAAGSTNLTKDFGYKASTARTISGTIWEDVNTEGTLDGNETGRFENVTIMLLDVDGNIISTTATDANGDYSFTGIPSGNYTIEVTDEIAELKGYWHTTGTDSETDPVTVDATSGNVTDVDFGYYKKAASLGNTVWEDTDGDGIQDNDEDGLSGVVVTLEIDYDDNGTADVSVATISRSDGSYSFDNLLLDEDQDGTGSSPDFKIKVTSPSGYTSTFTDTNANGNDSEDSDDPTGVIAIASMGETTMAKNADPTLEPIAAQYDFGLVRTGVVGNRVWIDEDGDGDQDAGEPGIACVVLELQNGTCTPGSDCPTTITDANGGYIFRNVIPGNYTVKVLSGITGMEPIFDENDGTTAPNMEVPVAVTSGGEYVTADFGYNFVTKTASDSPVSMTETGALGDRVWNDANSNGAEDAGEAGIGNITVNLYNDHDKDGFFDNLVNTTTTNANGNYFFDGLTPDAYVIEIVEAGITGAGFEATPTGDPDNDASNKSNPVIIAPGDVWMGGDFGYNNSNDPADIGSTIFIDADGDGTYNASNDLPLGGVTIALVKDTDGGDDWDIGEELVATTISAADGSYLFPDLPAGDYVVVVTDVDNIINTLTNSVDPQGGNDGMSGVTLGAADDLTQNFGYVPSGHNSSKAFIGDLIYLDQDGNGGYSPTEPGIEGVEVKLLDGDDDAELARTFTDENGRYFFGGLDAGNYKVKVEPSSLPAGMTNSVDPDGSSPGDDITNSFSLTAGAEDLTKDFGYKADNPRTISGTIWDDENAEGTLDGVESDRFSNVTIDLIDGNGNIIAQTTTDGSGAYSFTGVPSGSYTVEVTDDANVLEGYWHSPIVNDNESDPVVIDASSGNVADVDFGYYKKAGALGNYVWLDYDNDGIQDSNEPGLEGAKITLEIDYDGGGADLTVVRLAGLNGSYSFDHLLLDEDYQGDGVGPEPTYTLKVVPPNNHGFYSSSLSKDVGGNDNLDADDDAGVTATPQQGKNDVALTNITDAQTSYDFAFDFDCSQPSVEYAMTSDGSDVNASQTTDYFLTVVDGDTCHMSETQKYGRIRSHTYCVHGDWNYYFNPLDPEEYLFAIRHNSGGGTATNTTEIEYIELRMAQDPLNRFSIGGDNASFVMMRDWFVKTKNGAALTEPVDIRFYFPENEFATMYNSAIDQATNAWGVGAPDVGGVKWFKKDVFDPANDIDSSGTALLPFDITNLQNASTSGTGSNSSDTNTDGGQNIGQNKNHIQFNGLTGFSGGTAMLPISKLALPVKLSKFESRRDDCIVYLNWVTETETDFKHFEIQWSGDGHDFRTLDIITAQGSNNISKNYFYKDDAISKSNYYRLKMVDLDGSFEYSSIVQETSDCGNQNEIIIFPNPMHSNDDYINIKFYAERLETQIQITDMLGRIVKKVTLETEADFSNILQLDVNDLNAGNYIIQIVGEKTSKIFTILD